MTNEKNPKQATAAHVCSCGTSIVCMAQMGAMSTAGAAAGTMGAMAAVGTATGLSTPFITLVFQAVGLGFLLALPALFYQALLIIIFAFTVFSSYFSFRFHGRVGPFGLAITSSLLIYGSIYLLVSEPLYWSGFLLMLISGGWNYFATKRRMLGPRHRLGVASVSKHELPMVGEEKAKSYTLRYVLIILSIALVTLLGYLGFVSFLKDVMPAFGNYSLYLLAVVAGIATFFSPCSFPLLPGYLSFYYKTEQPDEKRAVNQGILAAAGVVTFTVILGVVIALLGQGVASSFSISNPNPSLFTRIFRIGLGLTLVLLGIVQVSNLTLHSHALDALTKRFYAAARTGSTGLFFYGFGYNAAGIGCAGPIMAGLIIFALGSGGFASAFLTFLVYSLTMASFMLSMSLLVAKSKTVLISNLKHSTPKIKKASAIILIAVGAFLVYATLNLQFFVQTFFPK